MPAGGFVPPSSRLALALAGIIVVSSVVVGGLAAHTAPAVETRSSSAASSLTASAQDLMPSSPSGFAHRWSNLSPSISPSPRTQEKLAYDPLLKAVVLFGGNDPIGNYALGDTWTYSSGSWTQVPGLVIAPPARWAYSFAYDPQFHGVVLFGGRNGSRAYNDTWVYRASGWYPIARTGGPSERVDAAMIFDGADRGMLLYGGGVGNLPAGSGSAWTADSDTWMLTRTGWSNLTSGVTGVPGPVVNSKIAYIESGHFVLMVGGSNASTGNISYYVQQTWTYRAKVWTHLSLSLQPDVADMQGSLAYDPLLHKAVLFGGATTITNIEENYTWVFTGHLWKNWTLKVGVAPPPRSPSGFAYDAASGYLVLFGGTRGSGSIVDNDTWAFS